MAEIHSRMFSFSRSRSSLRALPRSRACKRMQSNFSSKRHGLHLERSRKLQIHSINREIHRGTFPQVHTTATDAFCPSRSLHQTTRGARAFWQAKQSFSAGSGSTRPCSDIAARVHVGQPASAPAHRSTTAPPATPLDSAQAVSSYVLQQAQLLQLLGIPQRSPPGPQAGSCGQQQQQQQQHLQQQQSGHPLLHVTELSGGKINYVWTVRGPRGAVVLKYAAPYVRSIGPEFELPQASTGS